ncbi:MAG: class I tRNA ligase family protein, partial [Planctomycetota bacterium]
IMNPDGTLADTVPVSFRGLTMKKARAAVLEALTEAGAHDPERDVEDRVIDLAHSDRSKTPIEPYLADQWFVKMDELAQSAMDAVTSGKVKILPERYTKTYVDWLSEKRDWPVGRQLWWGHRIPVWRKPVSGYAERKTVEESAVQLALEATNLSNLDVVEESFILNWDEDKQSGVALWCVLNDSSGFVSKIEADGFIQDEEVLDTWFSSALWPFSTLGWPEETEALKTFYPTSTLITSRDIITLWVARMVLMGEYNRPNGDGEPAIPFQEVFIHPKILDGFGETMSKSKGNGVDPLDVIDKFGADALRFGIAYLTTETQDVRMPVEFVCPHCDATVKQTKKNRVLPVVPCPSCSKPFSTQWAETDEEKSHGRAAVTSERFELGRNFCNKFWNASRFALQNLEGFEPSTAVDGELRIEDRWLLSRLATVTQQVTDALGAYRYADAARTLYDFAWNEFCSFYVEMAKARLAVGAVSDGEGDTAGGPGEQGIAVGDGSHGDREVAQAVLAHGLDTLLRLLHPMTPFLTEEVWSLLGEVAPVRGLTTRRLTTRGLPSAAVACESVCVAEWPAANEADIDPTIESQFAVFQAVLGAVREVRQSQGIAWSETLEFVIRCDADNAKLLEPMTPYFVQMAKATPAAIGPEATPADIVASRTLSGDAAAGAGVEVHVDVAAFIDVEAERKRLAKELAQKEKFVKSLEGKLANEKFVAGAPAEVVEQERNKLAEAAAAVAAIQASLAKL